MPPAGGGGALPPTYVFEDLRGVLLDHVLRADLMLTGLAINSLLFAATAVGFARLLASRSPAPPLLQLLAGRRRAGTERADVWSSPPTHAPAAQTRERGLTDRRSPQVHSGEKIDG